MTLQHNNKVKKLIRAFYGTFKQTIMEKLELTKEEIKLKYGILSDCDIRGLRKNEHGMYYTEEVRKKAVGKALREFNKSKEERR